MLDTVTYDPHSPKRVEDIVGNADIWKSTYELIRTNATSHIVLVGPAGSGKSLFCKIALSGFQTLTINCTANFGLRDVRDSIRIFARGNRSPNGNLRWIVFEHADALTADTQAFLRRMLETTSGTTRILFECKDAGAISEPVLSRSTVVTVNAPEETECVYELLRRTNYKLPRDHVQEFVDASYGNMRTALLHALAELHCTGHVCDKGVQDIRELLHTRPVSRDMRAWIDWAIQAESTARIKGVDLRDILRIGWSQSPIVANACAQWSRLGGTSPRTLFFNSISQLIAASSA
jgi:replication-associated recombination protein RarA